MHLNVLENASEPQSTMLKSKIQSLLPALLIGVMIILFLMIVSSTWMQPSLNGSWWIPQFSVSVIGGEDHIENNNRVGRRHKIHDAVCFSECCDPFISPLYNQVMEDNCTRYRWVTIPDDGGRIGHGMSQAYILMVFLKRFEAHKNATGRGKNIVHIPVLPRHKELLLCDVFVRPDNVYTSLDLLKDICGSGEGKPVTTTLSTWEKNFDKLLQKNIVLKTWPMPVMHLQDNEDVYSALFNLYPAWEWRAQEILHEILNHQKVDYANVTFIAVHVRRTDYLKLVRKSFPNDPYNASTIEALMDYANSKHPNALFVLFSDDEKWCRENLLVRNNLVIQSSLRPELSFAVMKQCNVTIVTYGSFGLWAGIMGGGQMIRLMPTSGNRVGRMQNTEEMLPNVEFFHYLP